MKIIDFIVKIENYYGIKYRQGEQIDLITMYLEIKSENYLTYLFSAVIKNFSGQYKTLPDIAIFETLITEIYEMMKSQKRKRQIADLKRPALTDGEEVDYSEEMKGLFANMDKRFKKGKVNNE